MDALLFREDDLDSPALDGGAGGHFGDVRGARALHLGGSRLPFPMSSSRERAASSAAMGLVVQGHLRTCLDASGSCGAERMHL